MVPPSTGSFSTTITSSPWCAATTAVASPPAPEPTTSTSQMSGASFMPPAAPGLCRARCRRCRRRPAPLPGDTRGRRPGEERHHLRDVLGRADPAERHQRLAPRLHLRVLVDPLGQRRPDHPRRHRVDADAVRRPLLAAPGLCHRRNDGGCAGSTSIIWTAASPPRWAGRDVGDRDRPVRPRRCRHVLHRHELSAQPLSFPTSRRPA